RLVASPAEGYGREERAVGLDEQAFGRDCASDFAQVLRLLERDVSGERDHEAEFEHLFGHRQAAAEAVHDAAARRARPLRAEYLDRLGVGLARMDDDGKALLLRQPQLTRKDLALHVARRVVVVKVQTDLAPSDDRRAAPDD